MIPVHEAVITYGLSGVPQETNTAGNGPKRVSGAFNVFIIFFILPFLFFCFFINVYTLNLKNKKVNPKNEKYHLFAYER